MIVILGGAGMLGHKLFQILRTRFPGTIATTRRSVRTAPLDRVSLLHGSDVVSGVDAEDFETIKRYLGQWKPEFTINCVGVIKQRDEARHAIPSITINALFPHKLAEFTSQWGGRLIHFSTDCVFSGRRGRYTERDAPDAEDLYGRTKFLGEVTANNALTLRTSIIGRELTEHRSLLDWFLSQQGKSVRGFRRVIYSGVTTNEMAKVVGDIIENRPTLAGLYQVASEPISKYDLLHLIRDAYQLNINIDADDREVSDRSMAGCRFTDATGWRPPSWPGMVRQLADDETPYNAWTDSMCKELEDV